VLGEGRRLKIDASDGIVGIQEHNGFEVARDHARVG
jgi:hypothetical protein